MINRKRIGKARALNKAAKIAKGKYFIFIDSDVKITQRNLIKKVVDELLQNEASPEKIASLSLEYLNDKEKYSSLQNELKKTKALLSPYEAAKNFAAYIGNYLDLI